MKTLSQLLEYLKRAVDEQPEVVETVREQFYQGKIFNLLDLVECNNDIFLIVHRGTNHLVLEDADGNKVSKFPHELTIHEDQYGADFTYSQTLNKNGQRRKNHINRIEFSNSDLITKSKKVVSDTSRVQRPLILKPKPIKNVYKNLIPDEDDRQNLKSFVRKLEKTVHPEAVKSKKTKKINSGTTTGDAAKE